MSTEALTWVWKHSKARGIDRLVLVAIADSANDGDTMRAWLRVKSIAEKAAVSERTVQRSVRELVGIGELVVEQQGAARGDAAASKYRMTMQAGDGCQAVTPGGAEGCQPVTTPGVSLSPPTTLVTGLTGTVGGTSHPPAREAEPSGVFPDDVPDPMQRFRDGWVSASKGAGISDFLAASAWGAVRGAVTEALEGGEPPDDVLAALSYLACDLASNPRATPGRIDIALRKMRAERAEASAPLLHHRAAVERQAQRHAVELERTQQADDLAFTLSNGQPAAVPADLTGAVRSSLRSMVGGDRADECMQLAEIVGSGEAA
jgi:hypothetical protein